MVAQLPVSHVRRVELHRPTVSVLPPAAPASLLGTPVLDQGAWYLYLVRPAETAWLRYASYFAYWGSCYNSSYYDQGTFVAPVVDTIPATDIGSPPFLLK